MFNILRALVVTTGLLVSPLIPINPSPPLASPKAIVDTLVFATPLKRFIDIASSPARNRTLDWKSDGCSAPVIRSTGRTFDFTSSCRRHDFAYRNYKRIDSGIYWTEPLRRRIDDRFSVDMRNACRTRPRLDHLTCTAWASIFYRTVRNYAGT